MSEAPTVFQRRIIIGAVLCAAAFALVGIRLVHVTLMKSWDAGHVPVETATRADLTGRIPGVEPRYGMGEHPYVEARYWAAFAYTGA